MGEALRRHCQFPPELRVGLEERCISPRVLIPQDSLCEFREIDPESARKGFEPVAWDTCTSRLNAAKHLLIVPADSLTHFVLG